MPQDLVGEGDDHIMSFDIQDTTELVAQDVSTATATSHANGKGSESQACSRLTSFVQALLVAPSSQIPKSRAEMLNSCDSGNCNAGMPGPMPRSICR